MELRNELEDESEAEIEEPEDSGDDYHASDDESPPPQARGRYAGDGDGGRVENEDPDGLRRERAIWILSAQMLPTPLFHFLATLQVTPGNVAAQQQQHPRAGR